MSMIRRIANLAQQLGHHRPLPLAAFDDPFFVHSSFLKPLFQEPLVDIKDLEQKYIVQAEVPGWKQENINLSVVNKDTLILSGEMKSESSESTDIQIRKEINHSSFRRSFTFPTPVDDTSIYAKLKDGILTVEIPKDQTNIDVKKIDINEE
ncbi:hypothetical protein HK096_003747 [Nowakowskiella sp. JEL0078]|nr:hypothetical protein HK096_003747 [Nowakowskiella sp. JEL0078]